MIKLFFPLLLHFHSRHYFTLHSITETRETPKPLGPDPILQNWVPVRKQHFHHKYKIHNSKTSNYDVPQASYILTLSTEIWNFKR